MKTTYQHGKVLFPFAAGMVFTFLLALPTHAAERLAQNSAREQINALVLTHAGQQIDALAKKQQWQDYRYTFNVYIPGTVATDALCPSRPNIALTSSPDTAFSRMSFDVTCPTRGGWKVSVAVRPDVKVPVVMPRTQIPRDTVLTAEDLQLKRFNISNARNGLLMHPEEAVGMTSKRTLQPGKPLTRASLVQPLLVKRDQPVMIVSHFDGITASMPGVALKNGRKGEMIKIRNTSSQRVISGIVDEEGVVKTVSAE